MAITGNWKNSPAATGGENTRNFQPRNNWGDGADPRHDTRTGHGQWSDVGFPGPIVPPFHEEVPIQIEDHFNLSQQLPTFPPAFEEPAGHGGVASAPWGVNEFRSQETNNAARSVNRGMVKFFQTRELTGRGSTQTYDSQRQQSLDYNPNDKVADGQSMRALRGKNGLNLNNPGNAESPGSGNYRRRGWEQNRFTNRWMPRKTLTHSKRALHLNLAAVAKPSAGYEGDSYSPYSSPFDGRVTSMNVGTQAPMARREPTAWDDSAVSDGSDQSSDSYQYNSWGL